MNFNAYPNPATDNLTVEFNSAQNMPYEIKLTDLSGRIVSVTKGKASEELNSAKIDVSSFAPGLYIISLETNGNVIQSRMVIQ